MRCSHVIMINEIGGKRDTAKLTQFERSVESNTASGPLPVAQVVAVPPLPGISPSKNLPPSVPPLENPAGTSGFRRNFGKKTRIQVLLMDCTRRGCKHFLYNNTMDSRQKYSGPATIFWRGRQRRRRSHQQTFRQRVLVVKIKVHTGLSH
jgi:hypothetical protein